MTFLWDPDRYLTYADERGRPFVELLARVRAEQPRRVVDLGCGPGNLTELLARRWPTAAVVGLDSSPEMIASARAAGLDGPDDFDGLTFDVADVREWTPTEPVDVLVCNATLQWLPDHLELLPALVAAVRPGGWFAFQVPGNLGPPLTTIVDLAAEQPYAEHTRGARTVLNHEPVDYWRALTDLGCAADVWETTYLHVLQGEDPVFTWVSGTGARPTLESLPDRLRPNFEAELKRRLRAHYPETGHGVVLPFRRIFAVAQVGLAEQVTVE